MQQRRRLLLLLLPGAGVVGMLVSGALREREPEYGGKKLSEWVTRLGLPIARGRDPSAVVDEPAEDAIHHIGSNAVPYLLSWIQYQEPAWKAKVYARINSKLGWDLVDKKQARMLGTQEAFETLGPAARAAIPELRSLVEATNGPCARRAFKTLASITGDAAPGTLQVISFMSESSTNPTVMSHLQEFLRDRDWYVRDAATNTLRVVEPKALVPRRGH